MSTLFSPPLHNVEMNALFLAALRAQGGAEPTLRTGPVPATFQGVWDSARAAPGDDPKARSVVGLLARVLAAVIECRPQVIPRLFPGGSLELSDEKIKAAFGRLGGAVPDDIRFFFFVDGLDEYTG